MSPKGKELISLLRLKPDFNSRICTDNENEKWENMHTYFSSPDVNVEEKKRAIMWKDDNCDLSCLHLICDFYDKWDAMSPELRECIFEIGGKDLVMQPTNDGDSALHIALEKHFSPKVGLVNHLLTIGGKDLVIMKNRRSSTALHNACFHSGASYKIIELVVGIGGKDLVMIQDDQGDSALHNVMQKHAEPDLIKLLVDAGGEDIVSMKNHDDHTVLHVACTNLLDPANLHDIFKAGGINVFFACTDELFSCILKNDAPVEKKVEYLTEFVKTIMEIFEKKCISIQKKDDDNCSNTTDSNTNACADSTRSSNAGTENNNSQQNAQLHQIIQRLKVELEESKKENEKKDKRIDRRNTKLVALKLCNKNLSSTNHNLIEKMRRMTEMNSDVNHRNIITSKNRKRKNMTESNVHSAKNPSKRACCKDSNRDEGNIGSSAVVAETVTSSSSISNNRRQTNNNDSDNNNNIISNGTPTQKIVELQSELEESIQELRIEKEKHGETLEKLHKAMKRIREFESNG